MHLKLISTATAFLLFSLGRGDDFLTALNNCDFPQGMTASPPPHLQLNSFLKLNKPKVRPGNGGAKGRVYDNVVKWFVGEHSGKAPGFKWYQSPDIPKDSKQSIEHVYERQLIKRFLMTQIQPTAASCADMKKLFFDCGQNGIQNIFDQLPAMQFPEKNKSPNYNIGFAGLEKDINSIKGFMFNEDIRLSSHFWNKNVLKDTSTKITGIQNFVMLFDIIKDPGFQRMYDLTNNRVYQAYLDMDDQITRNKIHGSDGLPLQATWASNYKTWMNQYLEDIVVPAWTWASTTRDDLQAAVTLDTTINSTTKQSQLQQLNDIKNHPGFSQEAFKADFGLTWQTRRSSARGLIDHRPYVKRNGACSLGISFSQSGLSAGVSGATGFTDLIDAFPTSFPSSSWQTITTSARSSASGTSLISAALSSTLVASNVVSSTLSVPSSSLVASSTIAVSTSATSAVASSTLSIPSSTLVTSTTIPTSTFYETFYSTYTPPVTTMPPSTTDFFEMLPTDIPDDDGPDFTPLPESIDSGWF
ncbi:MAG: hypothetical protein Q9195_006018 [Heterodermia aff. obscurata]